MSSSPNDGTHYGQAGVDTSEAGRALSRLAGSVRQTFGLRDGKGAGRPLRGLGYYANVLELGGNQGLAVSCDGVGTKLIVAEKTGRYDTVGIDLIAMNVNDLICVGAEPIAMLDYIAVGKADEEIFDQLGKGLLEGCRQCDITIPGGELAQVGEMLKGDGATKGFDIVGTAIGTVPLDRVLWGEKVTPGDVVVGLGAAGLHSNGYTLARKVLCPDGNYDRHDADLGCTVADELLKPTALYVAFARRLLAQESDIHAICHITGDGFMNLTRVEAPIGFELDALPTPNTVFQVIQERGKVSVAEMYTVFNMGVGLCVILPEARAEAVISLAKDCGFPAQRIGHVTDEDRVVRMPKQGLIGRGGHLKAEG